MQLEVTVDEKAVLDVVAEVLRDSFEAGSASLITAINELKARLVTEGQSHESR
jgi:hypothetical protein